MYGIVEIKGHQYRVQPGDLIDVEKVGLEDGSMVEFDQVLFVGGDAPVVGLPTVAGALVKAKVIHTDRTRKVTIFWRKPGRYKKKNGHRQPYSALLITEFTDGNGNTVKIDKDHRWAKKYL